MKKYINKKWLSGKYLRDRLGIYQIAPLCDCSPRTIHSWLIKHNIPRRRGGVDHWSKEQRELRSRWNKSHPGIIGMIGKKHNDKTRLNMSRKRTGKLNGNWKGGITEKIRGIRRSPQYYQWRKKIFARDNYTCKKCGSSEKLHGHHILPILDFPKLIFNVNNGITLCEKCHMEGHHKSHEY
jgi:hypothetical protein